MGLDAEAVRGVGSFEPAFARALARPGPTLLDIDLDSLAPMRFPLPAHQRRHGTRHGGSGPMVPAGERLPDRFGAG